MPSASAGPSAAANLSPRPRSSASSGRCLASKRVVACGAGVGSSRGAAWLPIWFDFELMVPGRQPGPVVERSPFWGCCAPHFEDSKGP